MQTRGLVVRQFGSWRDVKVDRLELREPGPGELLIEVEAAALNFPDLLMAEGKYQHKPQLPFFAGRDVCGRVKALGSGVEGFTIGQRVASQPRCGAFAEHCIVPVTHTFAVPDGLDPAFAAAAQTVFVTVISALLIRGKLVPGERVMVSGAAGGVGLAAVQLARLKGAEVVALVSSDEKEETVRRSGAHHVVRVDRIDEPRDGLRAALAGLCLDGVDLVLDVVGGDWFDAALRCIRPEGRIVVVGFTSGRIPEVKVNYLLLKDISVVGSPLDIQFRRHGDFVRQSMAEIMEKMRDGDIDPMVTSRFGLDDFQTAAALIAERRAIGKIVILPKS